MGLDLQVPRAAGPDQACAKGASTARRLARKLYQHSNIRLGQWRTILHCRPRAAVVIELLSANSPRKREYSQSGPEIFGDFDLKSGDPGVQRRKRMRQKPDFRPILVSLGKLGQTQECLAGDAVLIAPVSRQIPC
jgi:hypothetical protein